MADEFSKETENLIVQFQNYQQQMQNILIQKESLKLQLLEVERALEELDKAKQTTAYKITGQIMVSKPVEELKKELSEMKENVDIRIQSLEKTESRVNERLTDLQTKLKE